MPLESKKNQDNDNLTKPPISEGIQQATVDNLTEQAIAEGVQQAHEVGKAEEFPLKVTESQLKMVEELYSVLGLALRVVINSAIKYAVFYAKNKGVPLEKIQGYPNSLGTHSLKVALTAEARAKLEDVGMTERISECVVVGIQLLHDRLIGNVKGEHE